MLPHASFDSDYAEIDRRMEQVTDKLDFLVRSQQAKLAELSVAAGMIDERIARSKALDTELIAIARELIARSVELLQRAAHD